MTIDIAISETTVWHIAVLTASVTVVGIIARFFENVIAMSEYYNHPGEK